MRARAAALDGLCRQDGSRSRATAAGRELVGSKAAPLLALARRQTPLFSAIILDGKS